MTKALDAAIRAAQEQYDDGEYPATIARAALHAALPAEPPEWWSDAYTRIPADDAWRALRAHLLGEDA